MFWRRSRTPCTPTPSSWRATSGTATRVSARARALRLRLASQQRALGAPSSAGPPLAQARAAAAGRVRAVETASRLYSYLSSPFAGTVEFMVDQAGRHYFLEVNPRVQVRISDLCQVAQIARAWGARLRAAASPAWRGQQRTDPRMWRVRVLSQQPRTLDGPTAKPAHAPTHQLNRSHARPPPSYQVQHTVTEQVTGVDTVHTPTHPYSHTQTHKPTRTNALPHTRTHSIHTHTHTRPLVGRAHHHRAGDRRRHRADPDQDRRRRVARGSGPRDAGGRAATQRVCDPVPRDVRGPRAELPGGGCGYHATHYISLYYM